MASKTTKYTEEGLLERRRIAVGSLIKTKVELEKLYNITKNMDSSYSDQYHIKKTIDAIDEELSRLIVRSKLISIDTSIRELMNEAEEHKD